MGEYSAISWTTHTFNPWWGCWKIADECKNCYADTTANRHAPGLWGRTAPRRFFPEKHWDDLHKWNRKAAQLGERHRVFIGSMCDWAEVHQDPATNAQMNAARARTFKAIRECEHLDFLLLTKRPESAVELLPWMASPADWASVGVQDMPLAQTCEPWPNVWIGVTAGTVASMLRAVPILRTIPAVVRFISCEPLLEAIPRHVWDAALGKHDGAGSVDWLIVGDESGNNSRGIGIEPVREARDAAERHGVRFHFKQWANKVAPDGIADPAGHADVVRKGRKIHLPILDGKQHAEFPK